MPRRNRQRTPKRGYRWPRRTPVVSGPPPRDGPPGPLWWSVAGVLLLLLTLVVAVAVPWLLHGQWKLSRAHTIIAGRESRVPLLTLDDYLGLVSSELSTALVSPEYFARIRNLANQSYRDFLSRYKRFALNPGRSIEVRLATEF